MELSNVESDLNLEKKIIWIYEMADFSWANEKVTIFCLNSTKNDQK